MNEANTCRADKFLAVEIINDQRILIDGLETENKKVKNQRNISIGIGGALGVVAIALGIK